MWHISRLRRTTIDRQTSNATFSSVAHQYTALLTLPDRNMPPMEADAAYQGCLPSCELHSRSLTVGRTCVQAKFVDCAHAISRLHTCVTQSLDCLRNLGILRMRNTISRLRKFSDCAEHIHVLMRIVSR